MQTQELTIHVTPEAARVYRDASDQERRKLDLLLSLRLSEVGEPSRSLADIMREASQQAQAHGLTPELLEGLLGEE